MYAHAPFTQTLPTWNGAEGEYEDGISLISGECCNQPLNACQTRRQAPMLRSPRYAPWPPLGKDSELSASVLSSREMAGQELFPSLLGDP